MIMAAYPGILAASSPGAGVLKAVDPFRMIALGVVLQALEDYKKEGDLEAWSWLFSDAPGWLDGLGIDFDLDYWQTWVLFGCPGDQWKHFHYKRGRPIIG